ncbi:MULTISPECIES: sigma-70 family RNA polymerase sigma factor [Idiomarina]|jgi:RNA polymerase sigma-70 factor (ECF subfamily)|nr:MULTISPECIES: sigma-70 family RNA polymerase sigma factor [Idiomarina]MAD54569.1 RNA polymerase subunit sigma [Idiomarinaceae bacterium]MEC7643438.1 sigma-70 family RNA polymerase sigma factor [Pseudomonadota bacterium]KXS34670.1 MAG: RNA polymerase sigma-70 factor, ECF subfamily [Idiomarina sp. T82-3]MBL73990.1 RNA polymerase subunit sigma [Idiomarinaceae bacterium]MBR38483.1 RNA polymerase subunit sigma [Idiomarina sp.]|tara:strand:- start:298 stop:918 length:621 start_codon:yes stop_codon:yes gene_type:complete
MQTVTSHTSQRGVMTTSQQDTAEKAAQLLAQIAETRSRQAFSELFSHFAPKLQAYGTRQFGNEQTAMDLVQETMTNVWHKAHLFKADKGSPSTWIFTIARNIRFDLLRKNKKRKDDISADELWPILAEQNDNLDDDYALDQDILLQEISHYYGQLPDAQRIVVEKIYVEGKSQQEVSDSLGIPLGTVKSRTRLALKKLKELIVEHD